MNHHDDVIKWKHFPSYWPFAGNSPVTSDFPSRRPVTRSFGVFFDLRLRQQLRTQWRCRWKISPLISKCLVLIEQYLPNVSGPVYSVYRSCKRFICGLSDINQHFSHCSRWFQNVDLLWRHRHMSRPLAIVTDSDRLLDRGVSMDAFL